MSSLSKSLSLKVFNNKVNQKLLSSFIKNKEGISDIILSSIKIYISAFLREKDIQACIAILEGISEQLLALLRMSLVNGHKVVPELLA